MSQAVAGGTSPATTAIGRWLAHTPGAAAQQ
ncbi:hypothetical protein RKD30_001817 [Streptomyces pristinaespiralis]